MAKESQEYGYIRSSDALLLLSVDGLRVVLTGAQVKNTPWVIATLREIASACEHSDALSPQAFEPPGWTPDGQYVDLTAVELAVVVYPADPKEIVVTMPSELKREVTQVGERNVVAYGLSVMGQRRHEKAWLVETLREIAMQLDMTGPN